jgi:addiction module RelE/StbE family toxin
MDIRYSVRARNDLRRIFEYLDERAPKAAHEVRRAIEASVALLADFPLMAPMTDEDDVRELTLARYPYRIYYRVRGEELEVLHVRDARRRPWAEQSEHL